MPLANFEISKQTREGIDCIYLKGYLDAHTAPELENAISESVAGGNNRIIINFRDLDYISSAGLRVFLTAAKKIKSRNGKLGMSQLKPNVQEVFTISGFIALIPAFESLEAALEAVR